MAGSESDIRGTQIEDAQPAGAHAADTPSSAVDELTADSGLPLPVEECDGSLAAAFEDPTLDERNDVMQVVSELEDQLDRHERVRETLEHELSQTSKRLQAAQQRVQELEWQAVTLQTRVEALEQVRQEVTLLEEEVTNANLRVQRLNDEYSAVEKERGRLRAELKAANKQLEEVWALRKAWDGLRADGRNLALKIEEAERARREAVDERTQLHARLQETAAVLESERAERQQQQLLLREAEDRNGALAAAHEELRDKLEAVRTERNALQARLAHVERESARIVEQRQFYEAELTSLRNSNRTAETALASVKKAFAEVRIALTETKARARRRMIETWPRMGMSLSGDDAGKGGSNAADLAPAGISDTLDPEIGGEEAVQSGAGAAEAK
jgi:chromosome segregation ATPase